MPFKFTSKGTFAPTQKFLNRAKREDMFAALHRYGEQGVNALSDATPVDSHLTASSWSYSIVKNNGYHAIVWHNRNDDGDGPPVAILIQYGHGTRNGGYVQGRDYINPVMRPIFDEIAKEVWKVVTK